MVLVGRKGKRQSACNQSRNPIHHLVQLAYNLQNSAMTAISNRLSKTVSHVYVVCAPRRKVRTKKKKKKTSENQKPKNCCPSFSPSHPLPIHSLPCSLFHSHSPLLSFFLSFFVFFSFCESRSFKKMWRRMGSFRSSSSNKGTPKTKRKGSTKNRKGSGVDRKAIEQVEDDSDWASSPISLSLGNCTLTFDQGKWQGA